MTPAPYFNSMKGGGKIILHNIQYASKPPQSRTAPAVCYKSIF